MIPLTLNSRRRVEFIDVTARVAEEIARAGLQDGLCQLFVPHTTAALTINEHADPSVRLDLEAILARLVPVSSAYEHREGNSDAHLKSSLLGCSLTVIVENGRPCLGTWQGIYFCEFDGPRQRQLQLKMISIPR